MRFLYNTALKIYYIFFLSFKKVVVKKNCTLRGFIHVLNEGSISIGENTIINSRYTANPVGLSTRTSLIARKNASLSIGRNVRISNSLIYCKESITIEDNVLLGGGCQVLDSDFHALAYKDRQQRPEVNVKSKAIVIKNGAFIGANSIILKGVQIGERSIIAAGSIVSKNVPDSEIWGGNPAKFIKNAK